MKNMEKCPAPMRRPGRLAFGSVSLSCLVWALSGPAFADSEIDVAAMQAELAQLRAEQAESAARIARLEQTLEAFSGSESSDAPVRLPPSQAATSVPAASSPESRWKFSGDMRLRYEANLENDAMPYRGREVVRGRLRGAYKVNDWSSVGVGVATCDPDDPNTADVTLTSFDDDVAINLDQIFWTAHSGNWTVNLGKFPNPFDRTDLVWDGDVNPQGASATYKFATSPSSTLSATTIYFIIDEASAASDSEMFGVQAKWSSVFNSDTRLDLSAAYFDYSLASLTGADSGDFRSNLLAPDGSYLSDFELVDLIATLALRDSDDRWPVRIIADYVTNLGAATSDDTGYGVDIFAGRASKMGDFRIGYGYAEAEADAVFAAFSHDNTNLPTNYRQHALTLDYVPADHVGLNLTYYHYQPLNTDIFAGFDGWQDRIRLNLVLSF